MTPRVALPILVLVLVLACALLSVLLAAPAMLDDEDARSIGWWPITSRDIALARLLGILRPVALASVILCGLPLVVFAVVGPIPMLSQRCSREDSRFRRLPSRSRLLADCSRS